MTTNTVKGLKQIYSALGGVPGDVKDITLISEMLYRIADLAAYTLELPSLNKTTDNGKVLTASNGKWIKDTIPSQLPAVTADDANTVLVVDERGEWVAGAVPTQG